MLSQLRAVFASNDTSKSGNCNLFLILIVKVQLIVAMENVYNHRYGNMVIL